VSIEHIEVNGRELTAFDLPPEPSEAYTVFVDGLGEIVVEKDKPPKEKDVPAMYMRKLVPELCEQNAALFRENAKLREILKSLMMGTNAELCAGRGESDCKECSMYHGEDGCTVVNAMELLGIDMYGEPLGIEVDE
jgi:hypothetical protein